MFQRSFFFIGVGVYLQRPSCSCLKWFAFPWVSIISKILFLAFRLVTVTINFKLGFFRLLIISVSCRFLIYPVWSLILSVLVLDKLILLNPGHSTRLDRSFISMKFGLFSRQRTFSPETRSEPCASIMLGNIWYSSIQISRRSKFVLYLIIFLS